MIPPLEVKPSKETIEIRHPSLFSFSSYLKRDQSQVHVTPDLLRGNQNNFLKIFPSGRDVCKSPLFNQSLSKVSNQEIKVGGSKQTSLSNEINLEVENFSADSELVPLLIKHCLLFFATV